MHHEKKGWAVRIGKQIPCGISAQIKEVIGEFLDVFAYTIDDMPSIDPHLMVHRLNIRERHLPVKQKLRHQGVERRTTTAEEVKKLSAAGFIREWQYTEWLANVVLVRKSSGAWKMCVDFTYLNKACPKDDFPLPRIDRLVDSTAGHALFSFMDANVGYH